MVNGAGGALLECWMGALGMLLLERWRGALGVLLELEGCCCRTFGGGFLEGVVFEGFCFGVCGFRMREVSGTRSGSGAYQKASGFGMEQEPE